MLEYSALPERSVDDHIRLLRELGDLDASNALAEFMRESRMRRVLFHGTTHDFDRFDVSRGNKDGHYGGRGVYLTTSPEDASANYATIGPDLQKRIEDRAERLVCDWDTDPPDHPPPDWDGMDWRERYQVAIRFAEKELAGDAPNILPVFVCLRNPVEIEPRGGTFIEVEFPVDEDEQEELDRARQELEAVQERLAETDGDEEYAQLAEREAELEDLISELEDRIEESRYTAEPGGPGGAILDAVNRLAWEYEGIELNGAFEELLTMLYEGAWAYEIDKRLRELYQYAIDMDGDMVMSEVVAETWRRAGYDGIIQDAYHEFGSGQSRAAMEGLEWGDKHVIVFDPTQIKSATGCRTFDPRSASLTDVDLVPAPELMRETSGDRLAKRAMKALAQQPQMPRRRNTV